MYNRIKLLLVKHINGIFFLCLLIFFLFIFEHNGQVDEVYAMYNNDDDDEEEFNNALMELIAQQEANEGSGAIVLENEPGMMADEVQRKIEPWSANTNIKISTYVEVPEKHANKFFIVACVVFAVSLAITLFIEGGGE